MDTETILGVMKSRLGITSTVRDDYLKSIIGGIVKELEDEKGIILAADNPYHLMFVVDYATWRYQSRDSSGDMPRHLKFRMHNLVIHAGGTS